MGESPLEESGQSVGRRMADVLAGHMRRRNGPGGGRSSAGGRVLAAVVAVVVLAGVAIGVGALLQSGDDSPSHSKPVAFSSSPRPVSTVSPRAQGYTPGSPPGHAPAAPPPAGTQYPYTVVPPPGATYPPPARYAPVTYPPVKRTAAPPARTTTPPATKAARRAVVQRNAQTNASATTAPPPTPTHAVLSYVSHRCISVVHNAARAGASIDIWDCDNLPGQRWSFEADGTYRTLGMCMTVVGDSISGAPIVLAACDGQAHQKFRLTAGQDIVHSGTNKCVDVKDQETHDGTHLQLWTCMGSSNQKWYLA